MFFLCFLSFSKVIASRTELASLDRALRSFTMCPKIVTNYWKFVQEWSQQLSKMVPKALNCSKNISKWCQEGSKWCQNGAKIVPCPRLYTHYPKIVQNCAGMSNNCFKTVPCPKLYPNGAKILPKLCQSGSKNATKMMPKMCNCLIILGSPFGIILGGLYYPKCLFYLYCIIFLSILENLS